MQRSEQTFIRAATPDAVARLPREADIAGVLVELSPRWREGSVEGARCTTARWRRGRASGTATVEVRPAGWGWSELELGWDGTGPRRRARTRRGAPAVVEALGAHVDGRAPGAPCPSARPVRGRTLVAAATTIAVIGASIAIGPLSATTPVTADDAVAQFRAAPRTAAAATTAPPPDADGGPGLPDSEPAGSAVISTQDAATTTSDETSARAVVSATEDGATTAGPSSRPAATDGQGDPAAATPSARGQETTEAPDPSTTRPPAGVYRYATDGWEELDTRGSHRRFPEETVQVVHHTDCGFQQIWEPIAERRDEHGFCGDVDPPLLVTTDTSRSFFGQQRQQRFTCSPDRTGDDGWTTRCDDRDGTSMTVTTRREGTERRTVGGRTVEVHRLRVQADLTGETTGQRRSMVWVRASDGLLVRSEVEADLEAPGPFGRVGYRERYVLDLSDLEPRT